MGHDLPSWAAIAFGAVLIAYGTLNKRFRSGGIGKRGEPYTPEWYHRMLPIALGLLFVMAGVYLRP